MHSHRPSRSDLQKPVTFREALPVVARKEKVALIGIALAGGAGCFLASTLGLGRSWTLGVAGLSLAGDLFYLSRATSKQMEEIDRLATERLFNTTAIQANGSPDVDKLIYNAWNRKIQVLSAALEAPLPKMSIGGSDSRTYRLELLKFKTEQGTLQGTFLDFFPELKTEFGEMLKGVEAADVDSYFNPAGSTATSLPTSGDDGLSSLSLTPTGLPPGFRSLHVRPPHYTSGEDRFAHHPASFSTHQLETYFFHGLMERKGLELPEQRFHCPAFVDARSAVLIDQLLSYDPQTKEWTLGDAKNPGNPINGEIYRALSNLADNPHSFQQRTPIEETLSLIIDPILVKLANGELNLPGAPGSKEEHFGLSLRRLTEMFNPFDAFQDVAYQPLRRVTVGGVDFDLNDFSFTNERLALLLFCPEFTPAGLKPEALHSLFSADAFKISPTTAEGILRSNRSDWSYRIEGAFSSSSSSSSTTYDARVIIAACLPESSAAAIPASIRPLLEAFRETSGVHLPTVNVELASFFPDPAQIPGAADYPFSFEPETRSGQKGVRVTSYYLVPTASRYETEPRKVERSVELFVNGQLFEGTYYTLIRGYSSRADQVESRGGRPGYGSRQFFDQAGTLLYRDTITEGVVSRESRSNNQGERFS